MVKEEKCGEDRHRSDVGRGHTAVTPAPHGPQSAGGLRRKSGFSEEPGNREGSGAFGGQALCPLPPPTAGAGDQGGGEGTTRTPRSFQSGDGQRREPRAEMWDPEIPSAARCRTENFGRRWFVLTERDSARFHFLRDVRGKGNVFEGLNLCCF